MYNEKAQEKGLPIFMRNPRKYSMTGTFSYSSKNRNKQWTDERINRVVSNDESLANSVTAFNGKFKDGHVTFAKPEDKKNFIKHLENLENPDFKLSIAYHGSPHDFDSFSTDAIGTGEGAQVHGWGLYFAGDKEVSEGYRDRLKKSDEIICSINGKEYRKSDTKNRSSSRAENKILNHIFHTFSDSKIQFVKQEHN